MIPLSFSVPSPYKKYGEGIIFTGVSMSGGGTPCSLVPGSFLVSWPMSFLGQGVPQSCHWSCPRSCLGAWNGIPVLSMVLLGGGGTPHWPELGLPPRTGHPPWPGFGCPPQPGQGYPPPLVDRTIHAGGLSCS